MSRYTRDAWRIGRSIGAVRQSDWRNVQDEEKDEGVVVVVPRCGDDCGGDEGSDEGRGLPHDGEEGEEEEPRVKARDLVMVGRDANKSRSLTSGAAGRPR